MQEAGKFRLRDSNPRAVGRLAQESAALPTELEEIKHCEGHDNIILAPDVQLRV